MSKIQQDILICITEYFQGNILFLILTQKSGLSLLFCAWKSTALITDSYTYIPLKLSFYSKLEREGGKIILIIVCLILKKSDMLILWRIYFVFFLFF